MSISTLKNKVVLITGASSGMGKSTAIHFAELGCNLALTGRRAHCLEATKCECLEKGLKPDQVLLLPGDLTNADHRKRLINTTVQNFGRLDVLINNAGAIRQKPNLQLDLDDFDFLFDINVRCVVDLSQLAIPHLIETKGCIVSVSSFGSDMSFGMGAYYNMAKAAVDNFTKCFALELAPKGVRVNAVNPGIVETEIFQSAGKEASEQAFGAISKIQPVGRNARPEEIARTISFLASPESEFITGICLVVDGGMKLTNSMATLLGTTSL